MIFLEIMIYFIAGVISSILLPKAVKIILTKILNKYTITIGLPLLMISAFSKANFNFMIPFIIATVIGFTFANLGTYVFFRVQKNSSQIKASSFLSGVYGNSAYLGIPLVAFFWGESNIAFASAFTMIASIFHYTFGIYLSNKYFGRTRFAINKLFFSPLFYGTIIAIIIASFNIIVPEIVNTIGFLTIYAAVFLTGIIVWNKDIFNFKQIIKILSFIGIARFVIVPLIFLIAGLFIGLHNKELLILLLLSIMPPALTNLNLALEYNFDEKLVATAVAVFTILVFLILGIANFFVVV